MKYLLAAAFLLPSVLHAQPADLKPIKCGNCAAWSKPQAPFNIVGNTWYVGPAGLSSVLITGPQGHILVDGTLPQAARQIEANIRALGFRIEDVKLIVNSHAHFDHAAGIAYLARKSGAQVAAGAAAVPVLESGDARADDPQYEGSKEVHMPKIARVRGVRDGETLSVGPLRTTAHLPPGHTPGGATWRWRSCETLAGTERCHDVVFADSLTPISDPHFRFSGDAHHPDRSASFRASIDKVAALPCDVMIPAHPSLAPVPDDADARTPDRSLFVVPGACRAYADEWRRKLDERLAQEKLGKR